MTSLPIPIPKATKAKGGGSNPPSLQDCDTASETDDFPEVHSPDPVFLKVHNKGCYITPPCLELLSYKTEENSEDEAENSFFTERVSASYPPFYPRSHRWTKPEEAKNFSDPLFRALSFYRYNRPYYLKRNLRKCSYVLAVTEPTKFIERGAKTVIDNCLYVLKRAYDGSPTGETCAIIGVSKTHIEDLLDHNSAIYGKLRSLPDLRDVPGIETLSPYRMEGLRLMLKYMPLVQDEEIILFNIEPKGTDPKTQTNYPCANVCIPGGGLEPQDQQSYDNCGRREFWEETGFIIPTNPEEHKLLMKQKFNFTDRQSMYFLYRVSSLYHQN